MSGHVIPLRTYIAVFVSLLALTALTTGVAYIDMGRWNTVVALAIAVTKMLLVVLFFMHVKYATGLTRVIVIAGFFWLAIMIALSMSDEMTRSWQVLEGWGTGSILPLLPRLFY